MFDESFFTKPLECSSIDVTKAPEEMNDHDMINFLLACNSTPYKNYTIFELADIPLRNSLLGGIGEGREDDPVKLSEYSKRASNIMNKLKNIIMPNVQEIFDLINLTFLPLFRCDFIPKSVNDILGYICFDFVFSEAEISAGAIEIAVVLSFFFCFLIVAVKRFDYKNMYVPGEEGFYHCGDG